MERKAKLQMLQFSIVCRDGNEELARVGIGMVNYVGLEMGYEDN